jgi:hypothetical protein
MTSGIKRNLFFNIEDSEIFCSEISEKGVRADERPYAASDEYSQKI